jgi:hypothetical protein
MASKPDLYYARRPFQYLDDLFVDQGQVVELAGVVNDEVLTRLGYFDRVQVHLRALTQCGECGASFISDQMRDRHGRLRHGTRERSLEMRAAGAGGMYADTAGEAEERRLEQEAPLYLDKSQGNHR